MFLTNILLRYKRPLPGGHLWRGKYRLYKEVKPYHLAQLKQQFELEEKNMFYLRHPYLTAEEAHGHTQALGKDKEFLERFRNRKPWFGNKYLGDRLGYLKITESWDD